MKYTAVILALLLSVAMLAGCAADATEPAAQLPNPISDVADSKAFAALDLYIDAPAGASDVQYSTISDEVAQVLFTLDGRAYTYRAAHTQEDISGVYETFDEQDHGVEADGANWYASVHIRTIAQGERGALAMWEYGTAQFSLYTPDAVTVTDIGDLAVSLAQAVFPHHNAPAAS